MAIYTFINEGLFQSNTEKEMLEKISQLLRQISDKSIPTTGMDAVNYMKSDPAFIKIVKQKLEPMFDKFHFPLPFNFARFGNSVSLQFATGIKDGYAYNLRINYYGRSAVLNNESKSCELDKKLPIEIFNEAIDFVSKTKDRVLLYKNKVEFSENNRAFGESPIQTYRGYCKLVEQRYGDQVSMKLNDSMYSVTFKPKK